jgi:hypothetical protein
LQQFNPFEARAAESMGEKIKAASGKIIKGD